MKKILVVLFALGLVFSFSAPVMATDVSVDGSYRIRGWSDTNSPLVEDSTSSAYYDQRLRVNVTFQVAEGLKVITRCDIMDGVMGEPAMVDPTADDNIEFDKAYVEFMTGVGRVRAGIFSHGVWGTGFGDLEVFVPKIDFITKLGNIVVYFDVTKDYEGDRGHVIDDRDDDGYLTSIFYMDKGIEIGVLYTFYRYAHAPAAPLGIPSSFGLTAKAHALLFETKLTMGDLYVEGEAGWVKGELDTTPVSWMLGGLKSMDIEGLRAYLMAKYTIGPAYVGGFAAYVQGDDWKTGDSLENFLNSGGDWDPCLILFNDTCPTSLGHVAGATTGTFMDNGWLYQVFAGASPMDKVSVKASLSYAYADKKPRNFVDDVYGTEVDLEAAYKIFDNLTYSAGFGYLAAGDYYKGTDKNNKIDNTYLLMNKLEVSF
ncbi:MAG: hypothetical protein JXB09_01175 [Deltaproteobacteria bacterium]|nr:hypothetical protein [Deltaproteobacteria bacterium]